MYTIKYAVYLASYSEIDQADIKYHRYLKYNNGIN